MAYDGSVNLENQNHPIRGASSLERNRMPPPDNSLPYGINKG
jgi:hypothetical protein